MLGCKKYAFSLVSHFATLEVLELVMLYMQHIQRQEDHQKLVFKRPENSIGNIIMRKDDCPSHQKATLS